LRPQQERIAEWFAKEAPHLGELYKAALRLLEDKAFPGRVHLICHAARDIGNRVPEVIAGRAEFTRIDLTEELDQLAALWLRDSLDRNRSPQSLVEGAMNADHEVEISFEVFTHLQILVGHHAQGLSNRTQKAIKMIEAVASENAGRQETLVPLARQWVDLTRWFQGRAHAGLKETFVDERELNHKFEAVEMYLYRLISGEFYEGVGVLDAILEDANS
jgi:hypothetical protein